MSLNAHVDGCEVTVTPVRRWSAKCNHRSLITTKDSTKPKSDANLITCHLLGYIHNKKVIIQLNIVICTISFNIATKIKTLD